MRSITRLTPRQQQIYDLVKERPRTTTEIIAGLVLPPDRLAIKVHISHMNRKLCYRGERICIDQIGGDFRQRKPRYRIVKVEPGCWQPYRLVRR